MPTRRRRPSTSGRRKTGKNHSLLRSLLTLLIVLLSLAAIAFAASFVYQRQAVKKETAAQEALVNVPPHTNDDQSLVDDAPASNQENAATLTANKLEGTWISTANGAMMTIKGETFSIDFPSVEYALPMKGKIKVEKETAVFTSSKPSDECGLNEGIYTYKLSNDDLFLSLKKDACRPRTTQLGTKWYKL